MQRFYSFILVLLLLFTGTVTFAQKERKKNKDEKKDTLVDNVLLEKQWSLGIMTNTNGFGLKFRKGHNLTALNQFMWEIELASYKSAKEVRTINPYYSNSKSYIYGKLNYLYFLSGGIGSQHIIARKPYWGGIQLSALYYGGVSIGITKPVYLYIVHLTGSGADLSYEVQLEKFNPDIHNLENIYGRGSYLSGILNLKVYPGAYVRGGLDFEFGTKYRSIKALEVGAQLAYSPIPIPIMAYNPSQNFFLTLYLSFSMGKRFN
jgi:hypothetical protein